MQVDIIELEYTFPIYIQGYVCEGTGRATKSDEFSGKILKGGGVVIFNQKNCIAGLFEVDVSIILQIEVYI